MDMSDRRSTRPKARQSLAHVPSRSQSEAFDRQNVTADLSVLDRAQDSRNEKSKRRTRGKSLGPGGLEALKESTGNANKTIAGFQPRSILKPAIPLTPPKNIPSFDELRKKNTGRGKSPSRNGPEDLLIDFSTPAPKKSDVSDASIDPALIVADPFSPVKDATERTGQDKQVSDGEEETKRQAAKKAILEQRAARRKSMANRRVSFAPEATLHTWSVVEIQEDSTTSSASNSTRRQSSMTAAQSPRSHQHTQLDETPSTPPEQVEEPLVKASPAHQRDLHQKKRRRSSSMSAEMDVSDDEVYSSSPSGDVTTNSSPVRVEDSIDSESDDDDGDTAMSMDDTTSHTIGSQDSNTQSSLDDRLRQAANQAGTRGIGYDEHGDDLSMELADGTVTSAFQPWAQKKSGSENVANEDQENINPFSPAQKARQVRATDAGNDDDDTGGMTMDMTQAVGRIVPNGSSAKPSRKSIGSRRRSSVARRRSSGNETSQGDETMEFTQVEGGIMLQAHGVEEKEDDTDGDATMEFTTIMGGVKASRDRESSAISSVSEDNDTMDMTAAVGGILATIEEHTEPQTDAEADETIGMDMTRAVGHIVTQADDEDTMLAEQQMQKEMNEAVHTPKLDLTHHLTSVASETGSPSLAIKPRLSARSKASNKTPSTTPKSAPRLAEPRNRLSKTESTPEKQLTPAPKRAETPEKTPLASLVSQRSASPKKLFQAEINARASPSLTNASPARKADPLFATDSGNGQQTPKYVLHAPKPHQHLRRRSSGVGIDKEGFGSPRVSELLDRRASIGDAVPEFKLELAQRGRIRFEDPRQIEHEIDAERALEERRESGRLTMEREADEQQDENATLQLKELIDSMTPKKNKSAKLKGRKSLAVGSARGLLGKRPTELDDDEDDEQDHTPKRLKVVAREGSPVKAVHLPKPPSKEETTGRLTRAQQVALAARDGHQTPQDSPSPTKQSTGLSPQQVGRFRDVVTGEPVDSFEGRLDNVVGAVDPAIMRPDQVENVDEKISLQQFLNMTNIHFIELSTTKRRATMAQSLASQPTQEPKDRSGSVSDAFVAASTTLPLLEMYQHATRELKSYISSGRKIVRSIEAETLAVQPPLFREYVEARPDVKLVMDNQFRNGKTNARLQSKEGWYTWRSQLVDGLHTGLEGIKTEMSRDMKVLSKHQASLDSVLPDLSERQRSLQEELEMLQNKIAQLESIDQGQLKAKRLALETADQQLKDRLHMFDALQQEMHEKEDILSQATELKTEMRDQIAEADRVREEYRGWPAKEVSNLNSKVDEIANKTGWSLVTASGGSEEEVDHGLALTMAYNSELHFRFQPSAFAGDDETNRRPSDRNLREVPGAAPHLSLVTAGLKGRQSTMDPPVEKKFFLQLLQRRLRLCSEVSDRPVKIKSVLDQISRGWDLASKISEEIRLLRLIGVTNVSTNSDDNLVITMMLMKSRTRVDVGFVLQAHASPDGELSTTVSVTASAVYGSLVALLDSSRTKKVQNALGREVESSDLGSGAFVGAIQGFEQWHEGQTQSKPKPQDSKPLSVSTAAHERQSPLKARPSAVPRSPLGVKKPITVQKKALPVATSRQIVKAVKDHLVERPPEKDKENLEAPSFVYGSAHKPAITPEMQEAMMQHTPIKRVGALRRSPIGGDGH